MVETGRGGLVQGFLGLRMKVPVGMKIHGFGVGLKYSSTAGGR